VAINDGLLTNNRRLVTKNMWFNGTDLTARAQRALRHEQVTIVANNTGFIHTVYPEATIAPESFERFRQKLDAFTTTDITYEMLANFLRDRSEYQKCFQIKFVRHGKAQYLPIERAFAYEHGSPYKVSDKATCDKLLDQIDEYDFYAEPIEDRIQLNKLSDYLKNNPISHFDAESMKELAEKITCTADMDRKITVLDGLIDFIHLDPELPVIDEKQNVGSGSIEIEVGTPREAIIDYLAQLRATHTIADLAFYATRDLAVTAWEPFLKAAFERNPVCIEETQELSDDALFQTLTDLPNESIYDGSRLAQPDEVWNFQRGDGLECALTFAVIWKARYPEIAIELIAKGSEVTLNIDSKTHRFSTQKGLEEQRML
jgi:hypothetical protein